MKFVPFHSAMEYYMARPIMLYNCVITVYFMSWGIWEGGVGYLSFTVSDQAVSIFHKDF